MLILHSTQCRRKTSQRPRKGKNPFSAPSHTIWRHLCNQPWHDLFTKLHTESTSQTRTNTICFYLLKLPMGRALGRGTMGA